MAHQQMFQSGRNSTNGQQGLNIGTKGDTTMSILLSSTLSENSDKGNRGDLCTQMK